MKIKIALIITLAALASLAFAPVTQAATTHSVHCEGSGYAYLHGNLTLDLSGRAGTVTYHDIGGDGSITASGIGRKVTRGSWTWIRGFHGSVHAQGSNIATFLTGRQVTLDASGNGVLRVRGVGFCTIDGVSTNWTTRLQELNVGE
jgi:autotransporter translocation and assembly factor TamB